MVANPRVKSYIDMVAGHTDVVHAVEGEHNGAGDSSVLYIPAVPLTVNKYVYARGILLPLPYA